MIINTKLPAPELFPNADLHWAKKRKYKKIDNEYGFGITKLIIKAQKPFTKEDHLSIQHTFVFADRRRRDLDNCVAAFKWLQDGIFLALGIDDHQIKVIKDTSILFDKNNPHTLVELNII